MTVERDSWPSSFPLNEKRRVAQSLTVWSLPVDVPGFSGRVEGRTTGGRLPCRAPSCGGWFIGVKWETGQVMYPCSRGWEYDAAERAVRMTTGSGLSTTVATDRPNVRADCPPRSEWPDRSELGSSWQVHKGGTA